jgi:DNA-binding transcriptional ArsR family regulator
MPEKPDPAIREVMVVDDPEAMKLLLTGKYTGIMDLIDSHEMSVSDIARTLKINPGSAHYHLKELEKYGLVKLVREEKKGNLVKKFYRTSARMIYLDGSRFKTVGGEDPMHRYRDQLAGMLGPFGYDISSEMIGPFNEIMQRYDRRKKELLREIQDVKVDPNGGMLASDAYFVAQTLKETEDREMRAIKEELRILLEKIRDQK